VAVTVDDVPQRAPAHVRKVSSRPRGQNDFYRTPRASTEALLNVETFDERVWEPACGDGAISTVLWARGHDVISTDLNDYKFGTCGVNFLTEYDLVAPTIITNPPFLLADQFIQHALHLGAHKAAFLLRLAFLEGMRRHTTLFAPTPPARVWVHSRRQTLWIGDDPDARGTGGAIAFAWFVWDRTHTGPTQLGWLT
jgi:hypothetical protein